MPNGVPIIPFEQPCSKALAEAVKKRIKNYGAVILENHGILSTGTTIEAACNLNAIVEEGAKIQFLVMTLAGQNSLDLAKLKEKFKIQNSIE
jgi:ribulose-5-phosphate 4-epimerase/fuculose-1-phosphate aldolase